VLQEGLGFPFSVSLPLQGYYSLFMKTKEGIQCICSHLFLPYFSIFSNYREIPCWGDDFLPSFSYQKCICRIIPRKLVKSMTWLLLGENVTQNLITFHIALPPAPLEPQMPDEKTFNQIVPEGEHYTSLLPHKHSCHGQLRHQNLCLSPEKIMFWLAWLPKLAQTQPPEL